MFDVLLGLWRGVVWVSDVRERRTLCAVRTRYVLRYVRVRHAARSQCTRATFEMFSRESAHWLDNNSPETTRLKIGARA